jgi:hypothetical protein
VGQAEKPGLLGFGGGAAGPGFGFTEFVFKFIENFFDIPTGFVELGDETGRDGSRKVGQVSVMAGSLIFDPPSPAKRFAKFAKAALPNNVQDLHFRFSGGGFADYGDTYCFTTSPSEVERLIRDMKLEENETYTSGSMSHTGFPSLPNCPDYNTWEGAK